MKEPLIYGATVAVVVFVIGWITGMGGSLIPNLGFSALMGVFAGVLYTLVTKYMKRKQD